MDHRRKSEIDPESEAEGLIAGANRGLAKR
jgi:hypothetical protein